MSIVRLFHVEKKWHQTAPGVRELKEVEHPILCIAVPVADPTQVGPQGTLHPGRRGAESKQIKAGKNGTLDMTDNQIAWAIHHGCRVRSADGELKTDKPTKE